MPESVSNGTERTRTKSVQHLSIVVGGLNVEGTQEEALVTRRSTVESVSIEQGVHHVHQVSLEGIIRGVAASAELLTELSQVTAKVDLDVVGSARVTSHISERVQVSKSIHGIKGSLGLRLLERNRSEALLETKKAPSTKKKKESQARLKDLQQEENMISKV